MAENPLPHVVMDLAEEGRLVGYVNVPGNEDLDGVPMVGNKRGHTFHLWAGSGDEYRSVGSRPEIAAKRLLADMGYEHGKLTYGNDARPSAGFVTTW